MLTCNDFKPFTEHSKYFHQLLWHWLYRTLIQSLNPSRPNYSDMADVWNHYRLYRLQIAKKYLKKAWPSGRELACGQYSLFWDRRQKHKIPVVNAPPPLPNSSGAAFINPTPSVRETVSSELPLSSVRVVACVSKTNSVVDESSKKSKYFSRPMGQPLYWKVPTKSSFQSFGLTILMRTRSPL